MSADCIHSLLPFLGINRGGVNDQGGIGCDTSLCSLLSQPSTLPTRLPGKHHEGKKNQWIHLFLDVSHPGLSSKGPLCFYKNLMVEQKTGQSLAQSTTSLMRVFSVMPRGWLETWEPPRLLTDNTSCCPAAGKTCWTSSSHWAWIGARLRSFLFTLFKLVSEPTQILANVFCERLMAPNFPLPGVGQWENSGNLNIPSAK